MIWILKKDYQSISGSGSLMKRININVRSVVTKPKPNIVLNYVTCLKCRFSILRDLLIMEKRLKISWNTPGFLICLNLYKPKIRFINSKPCINSLETLSILVIPLILDTMLQPHFEGVNTTYLMMRKFPKVL